MQLALTGATGFMGQYLLRELPKRGYRLRMLLRRPASVPMLIGIESDRFIVVCDRAIMVAFSLISETAVVVANGVFLGSSLIASL